MRSYPYIGKCDESGQVVLFTKEKCGTTLFRGRSDIGVLYKHDTGFNEREFKNITADYLRNTKIRIESPGHSEFVQKLVFGAGGGVVKRVDIAQCKNHKYLFVDNNLSILTGVNDEYFISSDKREIKLPMPPTPPQESKLNLNPNCVLNLIYDSLNNCKVDEWPQVGDEVSWGCHGRYMGVLLCKHNNLAWVEFKDDTFGVDEEDVLTINLSELIKPASPQENELVRKLIKVGATPATGKREREIAQAILSGEIEGLEYKKPQ